MAGPPLVTLLRKKAIAIWLLLLRVGTEGWNNFWKNILCFQEFFLSYIQVKNVNLYYFVASRRDSVGTSSERLSRVRSVDKLSCCGGFDLVFSFFKVHEKKNYPPEINSSHYKTLRERIDVRWSVENPLIPWWYQIWDDGRDDV